MYVFDYFRFDCGVFVCAIAKFFAEAEKGPESRQCHSASRKLAFMKESTQKLVSRKLASMKEVISQSKMSEFRAEVISITQDRANSQDRHFVELGVPLNKCFQ